MTQERESASGAGTPPRAGSTHKSFADLRASLGPAQLPSRAIEPPVVRNASENSSNERVIVRRERKGHGGKAVTLAEGIQLSSAKLGELARDAAKALGAGARVEDGALVVQGDQADRLAAWLASRGFISVTRGN
jgi:translation initiation factor 1 (eIF-1/SUI1)